MVISFQEDLMAVCRVKIWHLFGPRFGLILQRSLAPDGNRMSFEGTLNQPMLVFLWGETESLPGRESEREREREREPAATVSVCRLSRMLLCSTDWKSQPWNPLNVFFDLWAMWPPYRCCTRRLWRALWKSRTHTHTHTHTHKIK